MMQTELLTSTSVSTIGEEISHNLGAQMIQDYRKACPTDVTSYLIGREIIDQILAQPGCAGIRFYNAFNEKGEKTLVYVGVDQNATPILENSIVTHNGTLDTAKGIVADRLRPDYPAGRGGFDESWWLND